MSNFYYYFYKHTEIFKLCCTYSKPMLLKFLRMLVLFFYIGIDITESCNY